MSLVLDSGDLFHGQSIATLVKGESIAKLAGTCGYDAMTAGNHDWNYGKDRLKELVNITNENMLIGSFGLITFGVSLIPKNLVQIRFLENTVYKYSDIFMVFIFSFIILLFAYIKKSKEQLKNKESENIDEEIL